MCACRQETHRRTHSRSSLSLVVHCFVTGLSFVEPLLSFVVWLQVLSSNCSILAVTHSSLSVHSRVSPVSDIQPTFCSVACRFSCSFSRRFSSSSFLMVSPFSYTFTFSVLCQSRCYSSSV